MKVLFTDVFNLYNRGERLMVDTIRNRIEANYGFLSFYAIVDQDYLRKNDVELIGNKELRSFLNLAPMLAIHYMSALLYHYTEKDWLLTSLLKRVRTYDLAVDLGGETFQDSFGLLGVLKHFYTLKLLGLLKVRYAIISHTMVFKNPLVWMLVKPVLARASALTVRGVDSFEFMRSKNVECQWFPDIVFGYNEFHPREKKNPMRIGINASPLVKESISKYVALITELVKEDYEVVLIPHVVRDVERDDRKILIQIFRALKPNVKKKTQIYTYHSFNTIKDLMDECNLWIGSRMHSAIYMLGAGIPTIIIGYNEKNRYLENLLGSNVKVVRKDDPKFVSNILSQVRLVDRNYGSSLKELEQTMMAIKGDAEGHIEVLQSLLSN